MEGVEIGDVILKDQYDYNLYTDYTAEPIINKDGEKEYPRLSTEEFESPELPFSTAKGIKDTLAAYTSGKIGFLSAAHNFGFLLGSRDYQDPEKDEGIPMLLNLGNPATWDSESADTDIMGEPTGEGLMTRPKARPGDLTPVENSRKIGNLTISNGSRVDFPPGTDGLMNISLDFNSSPNAKGVEIIIPDDSSAEVIAAARAYVQRVKEFADDNGYGDYKIRDGGGRFGPGIFTTSENKKRRPDGLGGVENTIHTEPFFAQDAKMEKIVSKNFNDFAKIYTDVFRDLNARIVIPHGTEDNPPGAASKTFGNEYKFGQRLIDELMGV